MITTSVILKERPHPGQARPRQELGVQAGRIGDPVEAAVQSEWP
jgi:hypothetical protein